FFFQAEDGIRDFHVTGVQTCALPICWTRCSRRPSPATACWCSARSMPRSWRCDGCAARIQKPAAAAAYNPPAAASPNLVGTLMDAGLKQRLIGAAVLVALAVIFLPMLVKGPAPDSGVSD